MLIEATKHPIRYTMLDGREIRLAPGCPVDLPDMQAQTVLAKAPDRVRLVQWSLTRSEAFHVEQAACHNPVFWESQERRILGPGIVTHVAKQITEAGDARFWLCVAYGGSWRWVHERLLRTRAVYEAQQKGICRP